MSILWPSSSLISFPFAYNNGVSLYIADRSIGRAKLAYRVFTFATFGRLLDGYGVNLARTERQRQRERERKSPSLSPPSLSSRLSSSLLSTGDRVIEIETNERREVARRRRALCAEPRRTFRHPYGLFAGQLSIPSR